MVSKGSSELKFAVVDLDETLIEGSVGSRIAKALVDPRKNRGILPRRYYLKLLRYIHLPILSRVRRSYRIYRYVLRNSYKLYVSLLSDPRVDRERLLRLLLKVVDSIPIPRESIEFVRALKRRGYRVVLLTATPQELAEIIGKKLGVDEVIGSRPGSLMDREGKEKVLREMAKRGTIEIVVGNPGNEPFWMAGRLAIMVRSPRDLKRWCQKI